MRKRIWKPKRDVAFSIGIPLMGFSFSLGRFRSIKPLVLNCGTESLHYVIRRYGHLRDHITLQQAVENMNDIYRVHPLLQLQADQSPDVIEHQLELFAFR